MLKLRLEEGAPLFARECAVEVAAALGFRSVSMAFPVLDRRGTPISLPGEAPAAGDEVLVFLLRAASEGSLAWSIRRNGRLVELALRDAGAANGLLGALLGRFSDIESSESFSLDSSRAVPVGIASPPPSPARPGLMESGYHPRPAERGLESLFEREFLVKDEDFDFLPDRIDASIELPEGFDDDELSAACDLAARLGMESLGLDLPILATAGCPGRGRGSVLRVERAAGLPIASLGTDGGRRVVTLRGRGPALAAMASALCGAMPGTGDDSPLAGLREGIEAALAGRLPAAGGARAAGRGEPAELRGARVELPSELDACRGLLERELYPRLAPGPGYEVLVVVGEGLAERRSLEAEIRSACEARGAASPEVRAIGAFKQGFSWLRDCELPALAALGGVASIEIGFSAFLPAGRSAWNDEDGATPRIAPNRPDDPDAWLDPPVRLLQELYPIDDILAEGLGLDRDRVTFSLRDAPGSGMGYSLVARDGGGRVLRESSYEPAFAERPYLDDFPGLGKVHPGTGLVRLSRGGQALWEARFRTDMEAVWDAYQAEVLPAARGIAEKAEGQPFFSRLVVEVEASEPDEDLPCQRDRLSSLESLHEDLYFAGLDYFQTLGIKSVGKGYDSPGLILPVIRKGSGAPRMRYSILGLPGTAGERGSPISPNAQAGMAFVDELAYDAASGRFSPRFRVRAAGGEVAARAAIEAYASYLSQGRATPPAGMAIDKVRFAMEGEPSSAALEARLPQPPAPLPAEDISTLAIPSDSLIGPDEFEAIAARLGRARGIRLRLAGESAQGRPIRAVELQQRLPGYVSRTKLVATRPTLYVNGRHHANEVSSTNSALMLIRKLLEDPAYARLPERLNVVVLPLENVDGAAIHAELARDNPEWILHAARYDSLGGEFAREYFNDATSHPEALAFTRLWRDWLPDVVADDHGVPSHEWCQQFSGYTSPWFKGFWMPRALLYGYFWYVTDEAYAANKLVAEGMREAVADAMGARGEFASLNAEWRGRFEKYAHAWMPKLFPAEYHKDVIFYWVPYAYKPDYYYVSVRFPWVTAASFVSEVADETATGAYLGLCARAHLEEDLAIVELLAGAEIDMDERVWTEGEGLRARRARKRPLRLIPPGEASGKARGV